MRITRTRVALIGMALASALVLGACGDDDDDDGGGGTAAPAPTGPPIKIGFMNTENSPAGSYPALREGAEAAVDYINTELGGVNGSPLDMETCVLNGSGESSINCANRFVQDGKVAVSYGFDFGSEGSVPIYERAGVPLVGGIASQAPQLTSPNSFAFVGGAVGAIPAVSRFVGETLQAKSVSMVAVDLPTTRASLDQFSRPVMAKYGVTDVNIVYESPTAADWTPALTKANQTNPDAIIVIVGGASCLPVMQASQTLGIDPADMVYLQVCTAEQVLEAGGAGASGINTQSPFLSPDSDDPEVTTWRDAMAEYQPDAPRGPDAQLGFSSIMNLYAVMLDLPQVTPQAITDALKASVDRPSFMSHPYTCDGNQMPGFAGVCNANERMLKVENGEFSDITGNWIDSAEALAP